MTTAAIYCRISYDAEGQGLGVQRQEFECRELAERRGLAVGELFVDNDISAYSGKHRPAWSDLMERIGVGEFDTLIAWHPDRLTRHPKQLEALVDLLESTKTRVFTVTAGEYDLGTATGRMCARVVGAVARHESERKGERLTAKARQQALTGAAWGRGRRPYGFEYNGIDHRPAEARAIRRAAKQILAGKPIIEVAKRMPLTPNGIPWATPTLRRMLTAPRLIGMRCYKGEVVAVGNWKPILDRETWDALCDLLAAQTQLRPHERRTYLLSGIMIDFKGVAVCGRTMDDGIRRYTTKKTSDGKGCNIPGDKVDAFVLKALREAQRSQRVCAEWDDMNLAQRRALIVATFESIVLLSTFDANGKRRQLGDRVLITPR